jgi:uncharacterized membrane protein YfcA
MFGRDCYNGTFNLGAGMANYPLFVAAILFLAAFTQSLSGFGLALVSMALLPYVVGVQVATPLVAVAAVAIEVVLLLRYRQALNVHAIWRIVLASVVGIPFGIIWLRYLDERIVLIVLGVVIAGYALYALLGLRLPSMQGSLWAYLVGFLGGMLGGAYNTSGPPVIVYADCNRWEPSEFKSNLQGFFIINSFVVMVSHFVVGKITPEVWRLFVVSLPVIGLGLVAGMTLDRWVKPAVFRRIVQILLILMGLRLIF